MKIVYSTLMLALGAQALLGGDLEVSPQVAYCYYSTKARGSVRSYDYKTLKLDRFSAKLHERDSEDQWVVPKKVNRDFYFATEKNDKNGHVYVVNENRATELLKKCRSTLGNRAERLESVRLDKKAHTFGFMGRFVSNFSRLGHPAVVEDQNGHYQRVDLMLEKKRGLEAQQYQNNQKYNLTEDLTQSMVLTDDSSRPAPQRLKEGLVGRYNPKLELPACNLIQVFGVLGLNPGSYLDQELTQGITQKLLDQKVEKNITISEKIELFFKKLGRRMEEFSSFFIEKIKHILESFFNVKTQKKSFVEKHLASTVNLLLNQDLASATQLAAEMVIQRNAQYVYSPIGTSARLLAFDAMISWLERSSLLAQGIDGMNLLQLQKDSKDKFRDELQRINDRQNGSEDGALFEQEDAEALKKHINEEALKKHIISAMVETVGDKTEAAIRSVLVESFHSLYGLAKNITVGPMASGALLAMDVLIDVRGEMEFDSEEDPTMSSDSYVKDHLIVPMIGAITAGFGDYVKAHCEKTLIKNPEYYLPQVLIPHIELSVEVQNAGVEFVL